MKKHSVHAHAPGRRLAKWKRNLVAGVAVATLAPAGIIAGTGMASAGATYKDPTVAVGQACPADPNALTDTANAAYAGHAGEFTETDVKNDPHSVYRVARAIGAQSYYDKGYFGFDKAANKPIDIALIDTGVAPVPGLSSGNVVHGPDFSFDSQGTDAHIDGYGHGTHLASIMVGHEDNLTADSKQADGPYGWKNANNFTGIAPGARVVSVRTGDSAGAVDPSQVIAAIDWVTKHAKDPGFNIRVLNLAYGLNSPLFNTFRTDALSYAIEQAYNAGIVVVAAAGNDGYARTRAASSPTIKMGLAAPAFNPSIIAVGAYDSDTNVTKAPSWSQSASEANRRAPDFSAPGVSILGLRAPGTAADGEVVNDCQSATDTWTQPVVGPNGRFIRGSGTSQATAVVSAAVALMLSRPATDVPAQTIPQSPDWAKKMLKDTAISTNGIVSQIEGQGRINVGGVNNQPGAIWYSPKSAGQATTPAVGGQGIDTTRGALSNDEYLADGTIVPQQAVLAGACTPGNYYYVTFPALCVAAHPALLTGNVDIFGNAIDPAALAAKEAVNVKTGRFLDRSPWQSANGVETWNGGSFPVGIGLQPDPVLGLAVPVVKWSASPKTDHTWSGAKWSDTLLGASSNFDGAKWRASSWDGAKWRSGSWDGAKWRGAKWRGAKWRGAGFKAAAWS
jgi:serine protease AprX